MSKEIVYWKQKDGKLVSIDDMDTNHLKNVLKMIVKNSNKHKIQLCPYCKKPKNSMECCGFDATECDIY